MAQKPTKGRFLVVATLQTLWYYIKKIIFYLYVNIVIKV
jgi:hypothetical protein